ncbi:MAG: hypothetical protein K6F97_01405, partial [Lachnospiraceae bacterium]|nr:hypothetical protein [Lachnospiraceae bacterium]
PKVSGRFFILSMNFSMISSWFHKKDLETSPESFLKYKKPCEFSQGLKFQIKAQILAHLNKLSIHSSIIQTILSVP